MQIQMSRPPRPPGPASYPTTPISLAAQLGQDEHGAQETDI